MRRRNPTLNRGIVSLVGALALGLSPRTVDAQTGVVTGTVKSDAQAPVAGALVTIQRTAISPAAPALNLTAVTNDNGAFRITIPADRATGTATISVSSIGFKSAEARIALRPETVTQDFVLATQAVQLDEVVVTGTAGRMERRAQAAVVASVNAAAITQQAPVTSVTGLLQARTPGVVLRNESGTTGTATTIRIRGLTSMELSNDPLIFIDGIRMTGGNGNIYGVGNQERSRLNDIKVEEIESIEVVKGPAAAALYGSDANAGVINIITKRGRAQSGFIQTFNIEYGQADPNFDAPDNYARCGANDAANAALKACAGVPAGTVLIDNPLKRTQPFKDGRYRNLNWNLRGGGENYTVFLALGADDDDGTLPHNEFGHMSGRANVGFFATPKLHLELGFALSRTESDLPQNDNNIYGYLGGALLGDPRTLGAPKDGWYGNNRQVTAISSIENLDKNLRIQPRLAASYTPFSWFTNRMTFGADVNRTRAYSFWAKNDIGYFDNALVNTGQISEARQSEDRLTLDYLGNITQTLMPEIRADVSFGMQALTRKWDRTNATGQGLVNNEVRTVNSASRLSGGGQESAENRQIGAFAQAQFSILERLYLKGAIRRDQSTSFGADSKPFYSPSVGVSYVISDEPFFRDALKFSPDGLLNTLRLRAAYGETGRHPSSGARSTFTPATNQITATTVSVGVRPNDTGNPNIRAEKGKELELGFETALLNDRLGFDVTYFHKKTTDAILELPVPGSQGSEGPLVNVGALENKGFEVAVNARPITSKNVALELRLAGNTLKNKLIELGDVPESNTRKEGLPLIGVWQYRIKNVDLATNRVTVSDTLEYIGNQSIYPGYEGSFSANLTLFGNLTFYAQADGRGDIVQFENTLQFRDRQNGFTAPNVIGPVAYGKDAQGNATEEAKIKWMRKFGCIPGAFGGPTTTCPAWVTETWVDEDGVTRGGRTLSRTTVQGDYLQDASFIKLREISATYRLPTSLTRQYLRSQSASISVAMRNLMTWTDYEGMDPEALNFLAVPQDRRWTVKFFYTF
jgi:TonB-linked SusC/RagA family outer membrane protein